MIKLNSVSVRSKRNNVRNRLSEQPVQEESNENQSEMTTSAQTGLAQPDPSAPPMLVQDSSRQVFTIPYTVGSPSDPPPPYQSPQSFGESPPTYQAAAATGGFREENYKTDYGSAFTYS